MYNDLFIIAEIGVNHNGEVDLAKRLIDRAKEAGADAVKFQTFNADDLVSKSARKAEYQTQNTGNDESQYSMLKKLELSKEDLRQLKEYCLAQQIEFMSTPFDEGSADLLEEISVDRFKISSGDLTHLPMLKHIAAKKLPMIISTGMATMGEIEEALVTITNAGCSNIAILHCVSNYPAQVDECNLLAMQTICEAFGYPVGWSDHTNGDEISMAAIALGAKILEKHITLDRNMAGPDHLASMEPDEFSEYVRKARNVAKSLGTRIKKPQQSEIATAQVARRSIVTTQKIKAGERISSTNVKIVRPGTGLAPKFIDDVLNQKVGVDLDENTPLSFDHFKQMPNS